jgi:hypothetical protein
VKKGIDICTTRYYTVITERDLQIAAGNQGRRKEERVVRLLWISAAVIWAVCAACVSPLWASMAVPEIDPTAASAAVALLVCAVLILIEKRVKR